MAGLGGDGTDRRSRLIGGAVVHVAVDPAAVAVAIAEFVADSAKEAIASRGVFRIALAGGSTPRAAYEHLATGAIPLDWSRVEVFFGDERLVPPDHASSNYRMAREALLDRVPVPKDAVHRIRGELESADAVRDYTAVLGDVPLDLILLGMGDDGHVASLFPGGRELTSLDRVVGSYAPIAPHDRVSVGFSVITSARAVAELVVGAAKASRVQQVFTERASGAPVLPAARVAPRTGALHWFLDDAAASEI